MNHYRTVIAAAALMTLAAGTTLAQKNDRESRRLESITWSPVDHKLTWTVSNTEGAKKFTYEIKMDEALMSVAGEDRRFSKTEAVSVHRLMDLVAKYAAESTLWWEAGEGEPVGKEGSSSKVDRKNNKEHKGPETLPERPETEEINGRKIMRISFEGQELPVAVREIE